MKIGGRKHSKTNIFDFDSYTGKNTRNPGTEKFIYISAKIKFREKPFLSEIENPKSAPFSTKIAVWIDHTHKNFKNPVGATSTSMDF